MLTSSDPPKVAQSNDTCNVEMKKKIPFPGKIHFCVFYLMSN